MSVFGLLAPIAAFGLYTLGIIVLTGRGFVWDENRRLFYLGGRRVGLLASIGTFGATWMSAASVLGYTALFYREGFVAFAGSVNGWLLGLLPMPFIVARLRKSRVLTLPEWIGRTFGDERLRRLTAAALLVAYVLYVVIQFRAFGSVVAEMLGIRYGVAASALVYLFVLYTTFGGLNSVVRSDLFNFGLILAGVSVAAWYAVSAAGGIGALAQGVRIESPELLRPAGGYMGALGAFVMMFGWGFGVAANPQYAVRVLSASSPRTAWGMLALSPLLLGWIYLCLTLFALAGRVLVPNLSAVGAEESFVRLVTGVLPVVPASLLFVTVIAAAVSTANSQLLIVASSVCYDLATTWRRLPDDSFLFLNRLAVAFLATAALLLSVLPLPDILTLGRHSWAVVALCFLLPLYLPARRSGEGLFPAIALALGVQAVLVAAFDLQPEAAMLPALAVEWYVWRASGFAERDEAHAGPVA